MFSRSPRHYSQVSTCEAEIVRLNGTENYIAQTSVMIGEHGNGVVCKEPYKLGWMSVAVSVNKLLAAGARPEFISLAFAVTRQYLSNVIFMDLLMNGIADAGKQGHVHVTGLEIREGSAIKTSSFAIGTVPGNKWLGFDHCTPGDILFSSGAMGAGNLYAFQHFTGCRLKTEFKPVVRIAEARLLHHYASSCMLSSEGFFRSLAKLTTLNTCGLVLDPPLPELLCEDAQSCAVKKNLFTEFFLTSPFGEYELIYTIPAALEAAYLVEAQRAGLEPLRLGKLIPDPGIQIGRNGSKKVLDSKKIQQLPLPTLDHPESPFTELKKLFSA